MNTKATAIDVANDAVNQLEVLRDYLDWISSLNFAVINSLKTGHEDHALKLVEITRFLVDDYHIVIENDVKTFNEQLNAVSVRV